KFSYGHQRHPPAKTPRIFPAYRRHRRQSPLGHRLALPRRKPNARKRRQIPRPPSLRLHPTKNPPRQRRRPLPPLISASPPNSTSCPNTKNTVIPNVVRNLLCESTPSPCVLAPPPNFHFPIPLFRAKIPPMPPTVHDILNLYNPSNPLDRAYTIPAPWYRDP